MNPEIPQLSPEEPESERRLRVATMDDVPDVVRVFRGARAEMTYLPHLHSSDDEVRFLSGLIESGHVRVVEDEGKVVGFMMVQGEWLEHLYVEPGHQGKGSGKQLLMEAKAMSPNGLKLWVFEANTRASAFYEREGFRLKEKRDASEADNEEGLPDRLYEWTPGI
jgi:ribosomal protein S18 acetylase RimI-like enzyme